MFKINTKIHSSKNHQSRSGVFNVNFKHISQLFLVFLFVTLDKYLFTVQIFLTPNIEALVNICFHHMIYLVWYEMCVLCFNGMSGNKKGGLFHPKTVALA